MQKLPKKQINRVIFMPNIQKGIKKPADSNYEWDNRFYVNKMPAYDAQRDVHCLPYFMSKKPVSKCTGNAVLAPGGVRANKGKDPLSKRTGQYFPFDPQKENKGNLNQNKPIIKKTEAEYLVGQILEKLDNLLEEKTIPYQYIEILKATILNSDPTKIIQLCTKEIDKLLKNCSFIQLFVEGIEEREELLKEIYETCKYISRSSIKLTPEIIPKISNTLVQLRISTLKIVEGFMQFIDQLKMNCAITGKTETIEEINKLKCLWKNNDYFRKLITDTNFLSNSPLSQYYLFSVNSDPFLLFPSEDEKHEKKILQYPKIQINKAKKYYNLPISNTIYKRIKCCLAFLSQDQDIKELLNQNEIHQLNNLNQNKQENVTIENIASKQKVRSNAKLAPQNSSAKKSECSYDMESNSEELEKEGKKSPNQVQKQFNESPSKNSIAKASNKENMDLSHKSIPPSPNTKKINEKIQKAEKIDSLYIETLELEESDLLIFLNEYTPKLKRELMLSFDNGELLISNAKASRGQCWLCFKDDSQNIVGLCVCIIESTSNSLKRLMILHISVLGDDQFAYALKLFVDYAWANISCNEIRVGIHHMNVDQQLIVYQPVKDAFSNLRFRWKTINNNSLGERTIIMGLSKPNNAIIVNEINKLQESIVFTTIHIMEIHQDLIETHRFNNNNNVFSFSPCGIIYALNEITKNGFTLECCEESNWKNELIEIASNLTSEVEIKCTRGFTSETIQDVNNMLRNLNCMKTIPNIIKQNQTDKFLCGIQSFNINWESFELSSLEIQNINYKFIRLRGKILLRRIENLKIYTFSTSDTTTNAFVIISEDMSNVYSFSVHEIMNKLNKSKDSKEIIPEIWIPCFKADNDNNNNEVFENEKCSDNYFTTVYNSFNFEVNSEFIPVGQLKTNSKDKTVIEKEFIIGLFDEICTELLDMPIVYTQVNPSDWIKI